MNELMREQNLVRAEWRLMRRQTAQTSLSGASQVIRKGEAYWIADMEWLFPREDRNHFLSQSAQLQRLEGGQVLMDMWRPTRRTPYAFDGSGGVSAISVNLETRNVDLTCGGELNEGDMVAYDIDADHRFVGEIVRIVSRPGANQAVFKTQPRALAVHSTPNASVYQASGEFQLMDDSLRINEPVGAGAPATITARFKQVTP